jgi:predicted nucleic acid-binding protein
MRKTVYIETSIPSTYYEQRPEAVMVARREWTRKWWDEHRHEYELVTSDAVFDELERADHPLKEEKLRLIEGIKCLPVGEEIAEIVDTYLRRYVMPNDPGGDALHLALASFNKCDVLLTWNCQHLANANKFGHIQRVNTLLGLTVPWMVTPIELLGEDYEQ